MPEKPTFTTASRSSAIPLIVFYSESGCGKTYSALLLGRGIAGDKPLNVIDTERGRASIYADDPKIGGYQVAQLEEPYSPQRHIEYITAAEVGAGCVILDSGSHEWEGTAGVCNQAGENEEQSKRAGLHNWKKPKEQHALFLAKLMRAKVPIIVCLRAKYKTRQMKGTKEMADSGMIGFNQVGKTAIVKDNHVSPIQAEDFIFEATMHVLINQDHTVVVTKGGTPELRACLPKDNTTPITIEHGQAIARWIAGGGQRVGGAQKPPAAKPREATAPPPEAMGDVDHSAKVTPPTAQDDGQAKALKSRIWNHVKGHFGNDLQAFQQVSWDEGWLTDTETLAELPASRLQQVLNTVLEKYPSK